MVEPTAIHRQFAVEPGVQNLLDDFQLGILAFSGIGEQRRAIDRRDDLISGGPVVGVLQNFLGVPVAVDLMP